MILASANIEAQVCFGKLLLDQLHKRFRLADIYDGVIVAMYDPTSKCQQV